MQRVLLSFTGLSRPVALDDCSDLAAGIAAVLRGWQVREDSPATAATRPIITITRTEAGFSRTSPWLASPAVYRNPVNAVCDFLVDLMKAYIADSGRLLCLHGAAAMLGDGLVVFPSTYGAGKSVLSVHLAAAGARLWGDDVLPVDPATAEAIAPGFLPRLRLPLPADCGAAFDAFVAARAGARSDRFLYLDLGEDELAPLGAPAPVRGVVLLERADEPAPILAPASAGEVLRHAVLRNFSRNLSGLDILDRLHAIVAGARCFRLRYAAGDVAAGVLIEAFGAGAARRGAP